MIAMAMARLLMHASGSALRSRIYLRRKRCANYLLLPCDGAYSAHRGLSRTWHSLCGESRAWPILRDTSGSLGRSVMAHSEYPIEPRPVTARGASELPARGISDLP